MKAYRDMFGRKLTKQDVTQAVIHTVRSKNPYPASLSRSLGIGFFKAKALAKLLADAKVASPMDAPNRIVFLNEDAALNAAFRQLKKGNK